MLIRVKTTQNRVYIDIVKRVKIISYDWVAEIMEELRDKSLITKEGKITDTLKAQFMAAMLELNAHFSYAQKRAVVHSLARCYSWLFVMRSKKLCLKLTKQASPRFEAFMDEDQQENHLIVCIMFQRYEKSSINLH
ncbi:hypothetical protein [Candidatus Bartonella washoeensis]|uniref:Uncharacterized protein n=1 Tax=Cardidatus Bartonella washoeensis 085-0475 TaxID=1094564 RepID=J0QLK6_9HYPH|nr:hypothetical protein [Bartonella washoeensis]EJF86506.1 hypothetical protein MCW_00402 [Bartonella washoeensis 085-0475]